MYSIFGVMSVLTIRLLRTISALIVRIIFVLNIKVPVTLAGRNVLLFPSAVLVRFRLRILRVPPTLLTLRVWH